MSERVRSLSEVKKTMLPEPKSRADLEAENARLQARVEDGIAVIDVAATKAVRLELERDGYKALAERCREALDKMGCSYNLQYPCLTAVKEYPGSWCLRCRTLAATPEEAGEKESAHER